jgi:hypothetical protein
VNSEAYKNFSVPGYWNWLCDLINIYTNVFKWLFAETFTSTLPTVILS